MEKIIHTDKMTAIRGLINTWLKDPTLYCNNCDLDANAAFLAVESCCERPQIGRNIDVYVGLCKENKAIVDINLKATGATKDNSFRSAIALPPRLLAFLENYFKGYGEKLFNNQKELHQFMREFPQFKVCEQI
jgi:hypothetical protein